MPPFFKIDGSRLSFLLLLLVLLAAAVNAQQSTKTCPKKCLCSSSEISCRNLGLRKVPPDLLEASAVVTARKM